MNSASIHFQNWLHAKGLPTMLAWQQLRLCLRVRIASASARGDARAKEECAKIMCRFNVLRPGFKNQPRWFCRHGVCRHGLGSP